MLNEIIPLRVGGPTPENVERIIAVGLANNRTAALRVAAAIVARLLTDDPHVYAVTCDGVLEADTLFATRTAAEAWAAEIGGDVLPIIPR